MLRRLCLAETRRNQQTKTELGERHWKCLCWQTHIQTSFLAHHPVNGRRASGIYQKNVSRVQEEAAALPLCICENHQYSSKSRHTILITASFGKCGPTMSSHVMSYLTMTHVMSYLTLTHMMLYPTLIHVIPCLTLIMGLYRTLLFVLVCFFCLKHTFHRHVLEYHLHTPPPPFFFPEMSDSKIYSNIQKYESVNMWPQSETPCIVVCIFAKSHR